MHVLVHVHGYLDEAVLWPYACGSDLHGDESLVLLDVRDGRDLVTALVTLAQRGLRITSADTLEPW